jgi:hypothetical protein
VNPEQHRVPVGRVERGEERRGTRFIGERRSEVVGHGRTALPVVRCLPAPVALRELDLPGFAKFVVVKKPARPAREGINPFTKEKQKFAAKPASKGVRARPIKALKDAVA